MVVSAWRLRGRAVVPGTRVLLIKLALLISDLDLFAIVSGHVCADVTLASRDGLEEDGKGTAFRLSGLRR